MARVARGAGVGVVGAVAATAGVAAVCAGLVAAGGVLPGPPADPGTWPGWLEAHPPEVVIVGVVRLLALLAGLHLIVTCMAAAVAGAARADRAVARLERMALPGGRTLVRAAAAAGLALTSVVPGAAFAAEPTTRADDPPVMRPLDDAPAAAYPPSSVEPAPPGADSSTEVGEGTWHVQRGDHLWAVAERSLADAWGRPPSDAEIAPYWVEVIDANRERLADAANPDLVFPGQVLVVPPVPSAP